MGRIKDAAKKLFSRRKKEVRSPGGMGIVMSVGNTKDETKLPPATDRLAVEKEEGKPVAHACGHKAPPKIILHVYGVTFALAKKEFKKKCGACHVEHLKKVAIRCGLCGLPVMPEDPVALYGDDPVQFKDRARVTLFKEAVVGCMRWDCCPSGGFYAGTWTGSGVESAFVSLTAAETVLTTGKATLVTFRDD